MVAGCLRHAGYYMGEELLGPTASNPLGYYESREINRINEEILTAVTRRRPRGRMERFFRHRPGPDQLWLAQVRPGRKLPCPEGIEARIQAEVEKRPYCFKDPRFCYTLPVWRPFLKDAVFVCVFREPARSVNSVLADSRTQRYLWNLKLSERMVLNVWRLVYRHVLEVHRHEGDWLFLHYDQVLSGEGLGGLEHHLQARVDREFPNPSFDRASQVGHTSRRAARVYERLCSLAGHG